MRCDAVWLSYHRQRRHSFNPRTYRGCDMLYLSARSRLCCFNPRTMKGATYVPAPNKGIFDLFQSTHPYEVRQKRLSCVLCLLISIHAPVKGATCPATGSICTVISIHAPLRGATTSNRFFAVILNCFNPRTPAGCDSTVFRALYNKAL